MTHLITRHSPLKEKMMKKTRWLYQAERYAEDTMKQFDISKEDYYGMAEHDIIGILGMPDDHWRYRLASDIMRHNRTDVKLLIMLLHILRYSSRVSDPYKYDEIYNIVKDPMMTIDTARDVMAAVELNARRTKYYEADIEFCNLISIYCDTYIRVTLAKQAEEQAEEEDLALFHDLYQPEEKEVNKCIII